MSSNTPEANSRSLMRALCARTTNEHELIRAMEWKARWLIVQFGSADQPTIETFNSITDSWIVDLHEYTTDAVTLEYVFMLTASCLSEEWIVEHLAPTIVSQGVYSFNGRILLHQYLSSRYRVVTGEQHSLRALVDGLGNFQIE
ncbi:hypothetical protein F4777DRAFT_581611 [Nemania sp. FL0916]|nr:hypothetical protein F4777DRAFT_581611 [Nemania sp. FL0916]